MCKDALLKIQRELYCSRLSFGPFRNSASFCLSPLIFHLVVSLSWKDFYDLRNDSAATILYPCDCIHRE